MGAVTPEEPQGVPQTLSHGPASHGHQSHDSGDLFLSSFGSKTSRIGSRDCENGDPRGGHVLAGGYGEPDCEGAVFSEVGLPPPHQNGVVVAPQNPNPKNGRICMNGTLENGFAHHGSFGGRIPYLNGVVDATSNEGERARNGEVLETRYPVVVGLQPVALVDHVAKVDWSLLDAVPGERGGSMRVTVEELDHILQEVNSHFLSSSCPGEQGLKTLAGGSVANTIRGLAGGLGVSTALVGVRGDDDRGHMFAENMGLAGVDLSRLREVSGLTAQCACLVDAEGNRTMRPCFLNAVRLQAEELTRMDFKGAKWVVLNGYGFYGAELLEKAIVHCKQEGVKISLDLASFEVVRNYRPRLMKLLQSRQIDLVFANEDEARELIKGEENASPESCLDFLAQCCERAVVMLGSKGCIARHGDEIVRVPAIRETVTIDTTGAGDLFASGFLYGILNSLSLEDCCKVGCCTGGAVVRGLGGEVGEEGWQWMYQQLKARKLPPVKHSVDIS